MQRKAPIGHYNIELANGPWVRETMHSDAEIVKGVQNGHRQMFGLIVERYYHPLFAYVLGMMHDRDASEDIVQETFLRAFSSLKRLKDAGRLQGWLYGIAQNCCKEAARRQQKEKTALQRLSHQRCCAGSGEAVSEHTERLIEAVKLLSDETQAILAMKYQNGMSCAEVARALGKPEGTVRSILTRAYAELKERLKGETR